MTPAKEDMEEAQDIVIAWVQASNKRAGKKGLDGLSERIASALLARDAKARAEAFDDISRHFSDTKRASRLYRGHTVAEEVEFYGFHTTDQNAAKPSEGSAHE